MRILNRAKWCVQKLTRGLGGGTHRKAVARLVGTVICGSLVARSSVLWWRGRGPGLESERELKAFIQQVSRGLKAYAPGIFSSVHEAHLAQVRPRLPSLGSSTTASPKPSSPPFQRLCQRLWLLRQRRFYAPGGT